MKKISISKLRKIELEILSEIHRFCNENQIKYYICGGTLLGAIRHQGFIPWDDDIDICMPRADYDRFKNEFNKRESCIKFMDIDNCDDYYLPFGKVTDTRTVLKESIVENVNGLGAFVDVFPLDGLSNEYRDAKEHIKNGQDIFKKMLYASKRYIKGVSIIRFMKNMGILFYKTNKKRVYNRIMKLCNKYQYSQSKYVGVVFGFYGEKEIMPKSFFEVQCKVIFEGREFMAPQNFDGYLQNLYGDYMELPPVEKRISHHSFEVFYRGE